MKSKKRLVLLIITVCCAVFAFTFAACNKDNHIHEWETEYSFDQNYHWYACKSCDSIKDQAVHDVKKHGFNECAVCNQSLLGITYEKSSDGTYAIVTDFNNVSNKVRLASTYQGLPVKAICNTAFDESFLLTTIVIPDSVTSIEEQAFRWCYKLREVINLSPSITVAKGGTTCGYLGFRALSVFNANEEYKNEFIDDNGYITFVDGNETLLVDYVGRETSLTIPNYVTKIHPSALETLDASSIIIPNGVKSIGEYAFKQCSFLTEIVIPDSVTDLGDGAFRFCHNLKTVELGSGIKSIGNYAFHQCSSLTEINLPEGITTIGDQTFLDCKSLTYVKIPNSVKTVYNGAFSFCENLTSILIGSGVDTIEHGAFYKSENLQTIFYNGTDKDFSNINLDNDSNENFLAAKLYYYLETPPQTSGNFWYFNQNGIPTIWENQA